METRLIINIVVYLFVTSILLALWWKQKSLAAKIEKARHRLGDFLSQMWNLKSEKARKRLQKIIDSIESLITALVLVLVIQFFYIGNFKIPTGSMIPTIEVGDRIFANMVVYKFWQPKREDVLVFREPIRQKDNFTKRMLGLPGERVSIRNNRLYINGEEYSLREYASLERNPNNPRGLIEEEEWLVPKKGDHLVIEPEANYKQIYAMHGLNPREIQKGIIIDASISFALMPSLRFFVNGEETGPILDLLHDSKILNALLSGERVELTLDQDYYFVLGDNTYNSADSRIWGFVSQDKLRGKVMFRFWPLTRIGFVK